MGQRDETRRGSLVRNISNLQDGTERCSNLAWSYLCNGVDEVSWLCFWFSKKKKQQESPRNFSPTTKLTLSNTLMSRKRGFGCYPITQFTMSRMHLQLHSVSHNSSSISV